MMKKDTVTITQSVGIKPAMRRNAYASTNQAVLAAGTADRARLITTANSEDDTHTDPGDGGAGAARRSLYGSRQG